MTYTKRNIIYGPPGTGKTTHLIKTMETAVSYNTDVASIGFISFTRKSVNEAIDRVMTKFNKPRTSFPYFRTIHSMCMALSGIKTTDVVQHRHKKEIASMLGLELCVRYGDDGTSYGMLDGDKCFHVDDISRNKLIPIEQALDETGIDIDLSEVQRFSKAYKQYKEKKLLLDFTDMLEVFLTTGYVPNLKLLFVDEAQDLTPLQWKCVHKLEESSDISYIAGDDDQAIYGWNGADVDHLIYMTGNKKVLDKSYRVHPLIFNKAQEIISKVENRVAKDYCPRTLDSNDYTDPVVHIEDIEDLPLNSGEWLLLARNLYFLKEYEDHCFSMGYMYTTTGGYGPLDWPEFKAIRAYENLRKNGSVTNKHLEVINKYTYDKINLDKINNKETLTPWFEALELISGERKEFFRACRRNGEKLLQRPRIQINTIHGVKGGEADNVCIKLDMAPTTYKSYEEYADDEHRVFYVGITRARRRLFIKEPKTDKHYDLY